MNQPTPDPIRDRLTIVQLREFLNSLPPEFDDAVLSVRDEYDIGLHIDAFSWISPEKRLSVSWKIGEPIPEILPTKIQYVDFEGIA